MNGTMNNGPEMLARKFLNRTDRHIFLTGRAGTGKTTFLRELMGQTHKKAVIAAPTGVAAINAGGVTLHSLFQLPFGSYIPSDAYTFGNEISAEFVTPRTLMRNVHIHETKRRLIREIELLIIDEVSMLRADILDAIDRVLRVIRKQRSVPFGGVQLLLIGDLLQLPPVVRDPEWQVLRNFYNSIHFFESQALKLAPPIYIEFETVYRQSDPEFIQLLNHFRDNTVTEEDAKILNRHYRPGYKPGPNEGVIYLTTHNRIADKINREELESLHTKPFVYNAEIERDFNESQYPIEFSLVLKEGAQVMFIKNDTSGERKFFNGKIGVVTELTPDGIEVGFNDGSDPVWVEKHIWLNKRYRLSQEDNEIVEEVMGSFSQYPLKLAWAVTVHKSQGLTFDRAIIDVEHAFAPGQIYVALSRLVSLEGLILTSPVPTSGLAPDQEIISFSSVRQTEETLERVLESETHRYLRNSILQYYDFSQLVDAFYQHFSSYTKDEKRSARQRYKPRVEEILNTFRPELEVSARFRKQVVEICADPTSAYQDQLLERVKAAAAYFEPRLNRMSEALKALVEELSDAVGVKAYIKELLGLEAQVYSVIQSLRKSIHLVEAFRENKDPDKKEYLDEEEQEERRKDESKYTGKRQRKKKEPKEKKPKKQKGDSAKESFEMLRKGMSVKAIAAERQLVESTIEAHLCKFLEKGELDILEVMDEEKLSAIKKALKENYGNTIIPVKKALGDDYSFGEIRMVIASNRRE